MSVNKPRTTVISRLSEPFVLIWMVCAGGLIWASRPSFRRRLDQELKKTGVSRIKLLRLNSKRISNEIPFVTPLFIMVPGLAMFLLKLSVTGAVVSSLSGLLIGAIVGLAILTIIPLMFPAPSTTLE